MELHGSGELGQVLTAAAREGLYAMIRSHASPACQVGIAHHWQHALDDRAAVNRQRRNGRCSGCSESRNDQGSRGRGTTSPDLKLVRFPQNRYAPAVIVRRTFHLLVARDLI